MEKGIIQPRSIKYRLTWQFCVVFIVMGLSQGTNKNRCNICCGGYLVSTMEERVPSAKTSPITKSIVRH